MKSGTYWPNQSHLFTMPFYYIEYDVAQKSVLNFTNVQNMTINHHGIITISYAKMVVAKLNLDYYRIVIYQIIIEQLKYVI